MIRAAIFDLGGVVFRLDWDGVAAEWGARLGITREAFLSAMFGGNDDQVLIGRMTEDEWWVLASRRLGVDDAFRRAFEADLDGRETVNRKLAAYIETLRPRYRTAYLSNAWSGTRERLRARGVLDIVDEAIISAEVGVAKPDPAIFRIALERLTVEADEALFVDDAEANVEAARALGMTAVRWMGDLAVLRTLLP